MVFAGVSPTTTDIIYVSPSDATVSASMERVDGGGYYCAEFSTVQCAIDATKCPTSASTSPARALGG